MCLSHRLQPTTIRCPSHRHDECLIITANAGKSGIRLWSHFHRQLCMCVAIPVVVNLLPHLNHYAIHLRYFYVGGSTCLIATRAQTKCSQTQPSTMYLTTKKNTKSLSLILNKLKSPVQNPFPSLFAPRPLHHTTPGYQH